jgi:ABC-type glutathione transport system ATPase component
MEHRKYSLGERQTMSLPLLLSVRLQAGYRRVTVLEDIAFDLKRGEALGLIGMSGAGKTTLVMALLGLLRWRGGFANGEVLFEGANLLTMPDKAARQLRGRRFALVPQSPLSSLNGVMSLRAHFEEAWRAHKSYERQTFNTRVCELLEQMHLPTGSEFLARKSGEISVGQAQRMLIALSLLHRPSLLIADEPTSALDPVNQAEIVNLLHRLNRENDTTLLYISHDLTSVLQMCDRVAVLDSGRIVECLEVDGIEQKAQHKTTRALLQALPVPAKVLRTYARHDPAVMPEE